MRSSTSCRWKRARQPIATASSGSRASCAARCNSSGNCNRVSMTPCQSHKVHVTPAGAVFESNTTSRSSVHRVVSDSRQRGGEADIQPAGDGVRLTRTPRRRYRRCGPRVGHHVTARYQCRRNPPAVHRHRGVLAAVARTLHVRGALARDGVALRDDAQAHDLRGQLARSSPRHRGTAGAGGRRAQLGLPLHMGTRLVVLRVRCCSGSATPTRPRRSSRGWRTASPSRPAARPAAEDHVPRRRFVRPHRGDPPPLRGVPRVEPGAHRQRCLRPAPARYLRRSNGLHLPRRLARHPGAAREVEQVEQRCSTGSATIGTSPRKGSGRPAAARRTSPTAGSCRGSRLTAPSASRSHTVARRHRSLDHRAKPDLRTDHDTRGGVTNAMRSCSITRRTCSTRRCSSCRSSASSRRATRCGCRRCERWTTNSFPTASCTATTPACRPTVCLAPRARSRSARSGTSTRSPRSGRLEDAVPHLRKDAHVREQPRALLRGDRPHRRATRQLPASLQPPCAHQRRRQPRLPARPRLRLGRTGAGRRGPVCATDDNQARDEYGPHPNTLLLRLGIALWLLSWAPIVEIVGWTGRARLVTWIVQVVIGLIGLAFAGREFAQIVKTVGWRHAPRVVAFALWRGEVPATAPTGPCLPRSSTRPASPPRPSPR